MSVGFGQRGTPNRPPPNPAQVQKMLDENGHLIQTIQEYQSKGKAPEVLQYQQALHRNLTYLATVADSAQNVQSFLPMLQMQNPATSHGQPPPDHPHMNNFNHQQQPAPYRQPLVPGQRPGVPAQPYPQRGYQQNQYPGQFPPQNTAYPQGQYPPTQSVMPNQAAIYPNAQGQYVAQPPPSTTAPANYQAPAYGNPPASAGPQPGGGPYPPPSGPPQTAPVSYGGPPNGAPYPNATPPQNYPPQQGYPPQQNYPPPPSSQPQTSPATYSNQPSTSPQNYPPSNAQNPPFSGTPTNTQNPAVTSATPTSGSSQPYQSYQGNAQQNNPNAGYTSPNPQGYPPSGPNNYQYVPNPGYQPQYGNQPQAYQYRPPGQAPPPQGQYGAYGYHPPSANPQ